MTESIATIKKLWRGEPIMLPNGVGKLAEVRIYPRPIQNELPLWLAAHRDATFIEAGELDVNVLTVLWDTTIEDLTRKIELYRKTRARVGLDPAQGKVTLMLHTYIADTEAMVRKHVTAAYNDYLFVNLALHDDQMSAIEREAQRSDSEKRLLVERATDELFRSRGMVGTPDVCRQRVAELQAIGVDEIACLIDFGIPIDETLRSLEKLRDLEQADNTIRS